MDGEIVAKTLDFLSKEIVRFQEERRIAAIVKLAERKRRMREAEEAGQRQLEERIRQAEDEQFRQIMGVHQETVDSFLEEIITGSVTTAAKQQALQEVSVQANKISSIVDRLEEATNEPGVVVQNLVASFLIPEVNKENLRRQIEMESRKYRQASDVVIQQLEDDVAVSSLNQ
eukprot:GFYU01001505.1.p1 GENE.GFYU01001505.1~~GFYU01001505.1.p1  ORF type:complete len:173 (-),score=75.17 GFYU01001505.1:50-568(-)